MIIKPLRQVIICKIFDPKEVRTKLRTMKIYETKVCQVCSRCVSMKHLKQGYFRGQLLETLAPCAGENTPCINRRVQTRERPCNLTKCQTGYVV